MLDMWYFLKMKRDNMTMYSRDVEIILVVGIHGGIIHFSAIGN